MRKKIQLPEPTIEETTSYSTGASNCRSGQVEKFRDSLQVDKMHSFKVESA
jgi:hypothetical protein